MIKDIGTPVKCRKKIATFAPRYPKAMTMRLIFGCGGFPGALEKTAVTAYLKNSVTISYMLHW